MKFTALFTLALLAVARLHSFAWHEAGHQAVAAIAWEEMTPQARTSVAALLRNAPTDSGIRALRPAGGTEEERDRVQFVRVSVWADAVRNGPRKPIYHQRDWHFTDYFWEQQTPGGTARQRDDVPPHGELVPKLAAIEASLKNLAGEPVSPSKATDLAWFVHLMGDIAQPLHCSGRISPQDPQGDQGGNFFCLQRNEGRCILNLHSYWDHAIERAFGENAEIGEVARAIKQRHPRTPATPLSLGAYVEWARASQKTAMEKGYPATLKREEQPPDEYRETVGRISQEAVALAGYRLGATLNKVFGE